MRWRIASIGMGGTALGYTLDSADRITGLTETGQADKGFGYDNLDRLTSFENGTASTSYGYDVDGNRTSVTNGQGSVTYSYPGSSNRLSGLSGLMSATYSYDNAGNLTGDGTNAWSYDARGRMASHTAGGVTTSYGINGLGQRVTKSGAAVQPSGGAEYVYDGRGHVLGTYDASGGMLDETVWLGDMPVAVLKGTGGSAATYYVGADHLNAPHIITNSSGASVWVWDHLAFGDNAPNQNPSGLGVFSYGARFPGQMADGESGLNYNMFRDYAPYQGRYVQSDPIGLAGTSWGSLNTYGYVGGNPVTWVDQNGENPLLWVAIGGGAAVIHWTRNIWNQDINVNDAFRSWTHLPANEAIYHTQGPGNELNQKFISPDGHSEAVFTPCGEKVTDPTNMPTYNYPQG